MIYKPKYWKASIVHLCHQKQPPSPHLHRQWQLHHDCGLAKSYFKTKELRDVKMWALESVRCVTTTPLSYDTGKKQIQTDQSYEEEIGEQGFRSRPVGLQRSHSWWLGHIASVGSVWVIRLLLAFFGKGQFLYNWWNCFSWRFFSSVMDSRLSLSPCV